MSRTVQQHFSIGIPPYGQSPQWQQVEVLYPGQFSPTLNPFLTQPVSPPDPQPWIPYPWIMIWN